MFVIVLSLVIFLINIFTSNAYVPAVVRADKESVYKWKFRDTEINLLDFDKATTTDKVSVPASKESIGKLHKCFTDAYPTPNNNLPNLKEILNTAVTCMAKVLFQEEGELNWIEFSGQNSEMKLAKYRPFQIAVKFLRGKRCLDSSSETKMQSQVFLNVVNKMSNPMAAIIQRSKFTGNSETKIKTYSTSTQYEHNAGFSFSGLFGFIGGGLNYKSTTEDYEGNKNMTIEIKESISSISDNYTINPGEYRKFASVISEENIVTSIVIPVEVAGFLAFSLKTGNYNGKTRWILPVTELAKLFNVFQIMERAPNKVLVIVTLQTEGKPMKEESKNNLNLKIDPEVIELCQEEEREIFTNEDSWNKKKE